MVYLISRDSKKKLRVVEISCEWEDNAYMLRRTTYQYGGKRTVQPVIVIDKGKGLGKARKTVSEQAEIEFNSHIKKYLDKGYKQLPLSIDNYTKESYDEEKLGRLEKTQDKVKYTLEVKVRKDDDGNWKVEALTPEQIKKIQGMY